MNEEKIPTNEEISLMHRKIACNDTQIHIIRQNCLAHADNWLKDVILHGAHATLDTDSLKRSYFEFAKDCEDWIFRAKGE